jgi:uncharacterized membrane protein
VRNVRSSLMWLGLVFIGLVNGVLEDLLFISIIVPYAPMSLDLTGELFWIFTVPLAQLMALSITGTIGWFFLGLDQTPRLVVFWAVWIVARTAFLLQIYNPLGDVAVYLAWLTLWCALIGLAGYRKQRAATNNGDSVSG